MSKKKVVGICHICGTHGPLSEEHVPPKGAFNNQKMYVGKFADDRPCGPYEMVERRTIQGGVRMPTLCATCNNNTGHWYASAFIEWSRKGKALLERSGGKPEHLYCDEVYPLRILKQIATMFFSIVGPDFSQHTPDLVKFVLCKGEQYLPPDFRFFAYFNAGTSRDHLRYKPPIIKYDIETGEHSFFSEIAFPPFGYMMTLDQASTVDRRLVEITHFAQYSYDAVREVEISFIVLPTHLRLAGDYRNGPRISDPQ